MLAATVLSVPVAPRLRAYQAVPEDILTAPEPWASLHADIEKINDSNCNGDKWCLPGRVCSYSGHCEDQTFKGERYNEATSKPRDDLRTLEFVNGGRCRGVCDGARVCSLYGKCEEADYAGPRWTK